MTASVSTKTRKSVLITVPPILGIGFLMGKLSGSGQGNAWFDTLLKPPLMPSGWVFGVAWTALYILIGVALAIVWGAPSSRSRSIGLTCFFCPVGAKF
jgi:tryptophan-rich sensory protein